MERFNYTAKSFSGDLKTGVVEAENEHEVAKILRTEGFILISAISGGRKIARKGFGLDFIPFLNKVSLSDKIMFSRNLRVMIKAGVSLPRTLKILSEQAKSKKFKKVIGEIAELVNKGENFSDCLAKHPDVFSNLFCSMIRAGEESGTLEETLVVLVRQMEKEYELKTRVKGAMIYPLVILTAMIGIGILMMIIVVPKLAQTFSEMKIELPITTKVIIAIAGAMVNFWYLVPIIVIGIYLLARTATRTRMGKSFIDRITLKIPAIGKIVRETNYAHTSRTLSSLVASGVPIVKSLELTASALTNIHYKNALIVSAEQVKKGAKLSESLAKYSDIYSPLIIQMTEIGEETGETAGILEKLADFYEEEVSNATKNLSTIIEPVLMIVIGAAVGFFAISMLQPMYGMLQGIK